METKYKVSKEVNDLFFRSAAIKQAIKDGADDVVDLTAESMALSKSAWGMIYAEHPEIDPNKKWIYSMSDESVVCGETEYPITDEIREIFQKSDQESDMRDAILKSAFFLFRMPAAALHNKRSSELSNLAWQEVTKMYPETEDINLVWGSHKPTVVRKK